MEFYRIWALCLLSRLAVNRVDKSILYEPIWKTSHLPVNLDRRDNSDDEADIGSQSTRELLSQVWLLEMHI